MLTNQRHNYLVVEENRYVLNALHMRRYYMSDDEKYAIIGRVISQHEEAKRRLAALRAKAERIGQMLADIGHTFAGDADTTITFGPDWITIKDIRTGEQRSTYQLFEFPTTTDLHEIASEIELTKRDIANLEARRKELGVP